MKKLLLVCVLMIPLLMMNYALAIPGVPHQFYGDVTVNGGSAPDGTIVTAEIFGTEVVSTTTSGGTYSFIVDGTIVGTTISFFVEGVDTGNTADFQNGKVERIDLSVTISSGSTPSSGGGGGGGGGGGSYVPPSTTGDTTADDTEGSQTPTPEQISQPNEGDGETTGAQVEETETTTDTEPTMISRITGAFAGAFSSAENALVGILALMLVIIAVWFASKKLKDRKTGKSEEK